MNSKIAVIGCGWLGFSLAKLLVSEGYQVHGTTTSKEKLESLKQSQITPFLVKLTSEGIEGNLNSCLSNCQTAIINIPPGLRRNPEHNYVQKMTFLIDAIEKTSIKQVLFISSTSVYADTPDFPIITEDSMTSTSKKALQLLEVEDLFKTNKHFQSTILRFGGLYGEDRHPARMLSGRRDIKNPLAPINLIHRTDCMAIILALLQKNIWDTIFNASTTEHPTKQEYYTAVCENYGIPLPEFDTSAVSKGKIINASKIQVLLDYKFQVIIPSLTS